MLGLESIEYIRNFLLISVTLFQKTVGYFLLEPLFNSIVDNFQPHHVACLLYNK